MKVGFIGLGVMGNAMAGHLLRARGELVVWNRTPGRSDALAAAGATVAESPEQLAAQCQAVMICVRGSEDVAQVCDSLVGHLPAGALVIDHSTIAPSAAKALHHRMSAAGVRFIDAPITGGSMGAAAGQLTIFFGGSPEDTQEGIELVKPYTKRAERVGDIGDGQSMKLANQIAVAGALLALCECLSFSQKSGLDIVQARELIGGGAAGSWAFDNYGPKILNQDWAPGFSISNQLKDLIYTIEEAERVGAFTPTTSLAARLLQAMEDEGHGGWTTAALYGKMLELGFTP